MPTPEATKLLALLGTFALLIGTFKYKVCLPSAYLVIIVTKLGIYYPVLAQIRFELIIVIFALLVIMVSEEKAELLSLERSKILRYMFFFLVIIFVSMIQAFDIARSWDRIYIEILPNCVFIALLLVFCRQQKDIRFFLWTFGIVTAWLGYEPIYRYLHGDLVNTLGGFDYAVAEAGLVRGHTSLAHYLLQGMPILWYLSIASKNILEKLVGFGLFAFCFWGVLISGARGGMVGLVVIGVLISLLSDRPILMMISCFVAIFAALTAMGGEYLARMVSILQFGKSGLSAQSRIDGLTHGIEMLIRRPILGVGPGCYPVARKAWFDWSLWSHNHYGQLAGELGILGIIIWGLFARQYIKSSWVMRKSLTIDPWIKSIATAILVTSGTRLALGMFDHSVFKTIWYMLAAIVVVFEGLTIKTALAINDKS
ncbi:O-antigen ligase family protein [Thermodesulfobacteriota bacterium]